MVQIGRSRPHHDRRSAMKLATRCPSGTARFACAASLLGALLLGVAARAPAQTLAGALDPSFGSGGRVATAAAGGGAAAITMQADGKYVVAGTHTGGGSWILARFASDGSLDPTFGVSGVVL